MEGKIMADFSNEFFKFISFRAAGQKLLKILK